MTDNRLTELEIRYTYLEQVVSKLSQVVHAQQQSLGLLETRLERLEGIIAEAIQQPGEGLPHEKPPHY